MFVAAYAGAEACAVIRDAPSSAAPANAMSLPVLIREHGAVRVMGLSRISDSRVSVDMRPEPRRASAEQNSLRDSHVVDLRDSHVVDVFVGVKGEAVDTARARAERRTGHAGIPGGGVAIRRATVIARGWVKIVRVRISRATGIVSVGGGVLIASQ